MNWLADVIRAGLRARQHGVRSAANPSASMAGRNTRATGHLAIGCGVVLLALACGGAEPEGLKPTAHEVPPADLGLDEVVGRWEAVVADPDGWSVLQDCRGETRFVEIRTTGEGGWELVAGSARGLLLLPVVKASPGTDGLQITLDGEPPVTASLHEEGTRAHFLPLFEGLTFARSVEASTLPTVTDPACP